MDADVFLAVALLLLAALTLLVTAAAEAGIVTISPGRARLLAERGEPRGRALHRQTNERAATYAAFTVVRNVTLAGATSALAYLLLQGFDSIAAALLVAFLAAVIASLLLQLVPQFLVMHRLERWALALTPLAQAIRFVFWPVGWLFTLPARWWLHGRDDDSAGDEIVEAEELLRLVEMENGDLRVEADEAEMIRGVIRLDETLVREIMVPRIDIVAVDANGSVEDVLRVIVERGFSRVPIYEESVDNIVGVVYAKDLLKAMAQGSIDTMSPRALARPPYFIPEAKKVDDLLRELRQSKVHIAIVVDEYGGTAGLVTIEDLLEEIVGEIEDEYDVAEVNIERISETEAILDARVPIDDLARLFDIEIDSEDFDTVGGFVYTHLGKIPSVGDEVQVNGLRVRILSVDDRRIKKVLVRHVNGAEDHEQSEPQPVEGKSERAS